jgi:CarD family transcriptional regulator
MKMAVKKKPAAKADAKSRAKVVPAKGAALERGKPASPTAAPRGAAATTGRVAPKSHAAAKPQPVKKPAQEKPAAAKPVAAKAAPAKAPPRPAAAAAAPPAVKVEPRAHVKAAATAAPKAGAAPAVAAAKPPVAPPLTRPVAPAGQRVMPAAVAKSNVVRAAAAPQTPRDIAQKAVEARQAMVAHKKPAATQPASAPAKPVNQRHGFKCNEFIVYPAHGVGRIVGIEEQEIAGMSLELFVITFEKDKMTLRVPTGKLQSVGMRKLSDEGIVTRAMDTLKGRARIKRTMWSRRAQEYEAKINSGDLIAIAEVVRDLYRSEAQPEQSYSERQLYEAALDRMAREIAAVDKLDERGAIQRITEVLAKSAKGRRLAVEGAEPTADGEVQAA